MGSPPRLGAAPVRERVVELKRRLAPTPREAYGARTMHRWLIGAAFVLTGCLGRTGLSAEDLEAFEDPIDTGTTVDSGITIVEAGADSSMPPPPDAGRDTFIDIWEVFPIPDSGPIGACASCVRDKCGDRVNACINDPACRAGLACTMTRCLAGGGGGGPGGFDFACVAGCFGGDIGKAGLAISTFTCVIGTCGSACGGLLGGGGGFPGGGGGGGSGGSGGGGGGGMGFKDFTPAELKTLPGDTRFTFRTEAFAPWSHEIRASACEQKLITCAP